ncbi:MAG: hypothetical protein MUP31_03205 [Xanthomonadales bacterium]|nr:hypothetical protein [Xanthomonadales bacterium]
MNRVTRFSSAAFGMLMLAGLAYYQGHEDLAAGEQGSLVGTAITKPPEQRDINCENPDGLDEQDREYCDGNNPSGKAY